MVLLGKFHHVKAVVGFEVPLEELGAVGFEFGDTAGVGDIKDNIYIVFIDHHLT